MAPGWGFGLAVGMTVWARRWRVGRSLATQFALVGGVVLVVATVVIGSFVVDRIEQAVVRNAANETAIFMESLLSPISTQLALGEGLSPGARRAVEETFTNTTLRERLVSFKIWSLDGQVIEATDPDIVGRAFPVTEERARALAGEVVAEVRAWSRGLSLPEIAGVEPGAIVRLAVEAHESRPGHAVEVEEHGEAPPMGMEDRICVFRFVQEALNNASRHAGGAPLGVQIWAGKGRLQVAVMDRGQGPVGMAGLGLSGLRDRVESLGVGTNVVMVLEPGVQG